MALKTYLETSEVLPSFQRGCRYLYSHFAAHSYSKKNNTPELYSRSPCLHTLGKPLIR